MKKKEITVIEPNAIAEAKGQKMSKSYLDTLHIALSLVANEGMTADPQNLDYEFSVMDYKDRFGLKFDANAYKKLRLAVRNTMKNDSLLTIVDTNGHEVDFFPFQEVEYIPDEYKVHIVFSRKFKKLLVDLLRSKGRKIYYALPDTLRMRSEYSKKFYPILLEYIGNPMKFTGSGTLNGQRFDRIDSIENFKEILGIPKSYVIKNVKDTCNVIVAEIEAYTPYCVEVFYNQISGRGRYGGKTTHICWKIWKKEKEKKEKKEKPVVKEVPIEAQEKKDDLVSWIMDMTGLQESSAKRIAASAEKYGRDKDFIEQSYQSCCETGAEDLGALMNHHMKNGVPERKKVVKKNSFHNFQERPEEEVMKGYEKLMQMRMKELINGK